MRLIVTTPDAMPDDFVLYAQSMKTYEVCGYSDAEGYTEVDEIPEGFSQRVLPPRYGNYLTVKQIEEGLWLENGGMDKIADMSEALTTLGAIPTEPMASAQRVRQSMDAAGAVLTDEQALAAPALYLSWQPDGVYATGYRVRYGDLLYKCLQGHTAQAGWKPDATPALWTRIDNPAEEWPEIRNPIPSTNPYMKGDKVTYKGKQYVSKLDNNVWLPDAYPAAWELQP